MEVGSPDGHILLLAVFLPGDIFGDMSILAASERRSGTVVALEPAAAVVIEREEFERIRRTDAEISELVSAMLASRVRAAVHRIAELAHVPSPLRVLRVLARLTEAYTNGEGPTVVSFSQERLARFAGTSRDTVNRVLRKAEREGWLDVRRERILVRDCDELLRRAGS
jgi:CRP/FNR family transcriptional regulator